MDSQYYLHNAIGYQTSLKLGVKVSPDFLVVGINTEKIKDNRGEQLTEGADEMINLIEKQVVPYIDKTYATNGRNIYFGWQFDAMFGLTMFNASTDLFQGYLLASGQYYSKEALNRLDEHLAKQEKSTHQFYLSLGEMERHTLDGHKVMTAIFEKHQDRGLQWEFSYFDRFSTRIDHHTTPLESLTHGLAWLFADFPDLTFHSVDDIKSFGGAEAVIAYYQNRAKKYGESSEVGEQAKFSIFRHAAQENDYPLFQHFEQVFGKLEVKGWYHFFGQFYLKNNDIARAEETYKLGVASSPENAGYWAELAQVYKIKKQKNKAIECYQQALSLLDDTHEYYSEYQKELNALMKS